MPEPLTVLLLGSTGRTGRCVLRQLLDRGIAVRAIVRRGSGPSGLAGPVPGLTLVEGDLLALSDEDLRVQVHGCDAVISCLGHNLTLSGVFGPPRDLVTRAVERVCRAIHSLDPERAVKLVVMSSVSVNGPRDRDTRRGPVEKAVLWLIRALIPPAEDNQRAADFLRDEIGGADRQVEWVIVRPDTLGDAQPLEYDVHDGLANGLFAPGHTTRFAVAHFMCELVADGTTWRRWAGRLPVIVDAGRADVRAEGERTALSHGTGS